jgi:hypothetical protein
MVKVTDEGLFPVPRAKVWKLIEAHATDLQSIHPGVKSVKFLRKEGVSDVVEQQWDQNGQTTKMVMKLTPNPPGQLTLEILEGPMTGQIVNNYTEVANGTKVVTTCDMKSQFMDDKQLEGAVKEFMNNGFDDDLRYLNTKMK